MKNFLYFEAGGSNYDIGYTIGQKTRDLILKVLNKGKKKLLKKTKKSYAALVESGKKQLEFCRGDFAPYLQELQGIADGAKLPFADIIFLTFEEEFFESALFSKGEARNEHCTSIAISEGNNFYLAHNEDYDREFYNGLYIVKILADGEPQCLAVGYPGALAGSVCGINRYGIVFSGNSIHLGSEPGLPKTFISRRLLEAKNLREAIAIASSKPRSLAQNITIVSAKEQKIISFEATHSQESILTASRRYLVHTNHLLSPDLDNKKEISSIYSRLKFIHADFLLARKQGKIDIEFLKSVLTAPKVFIKTILTDPGQTIASMILDAKNLTLLVKNTYRGSNPYVSYNLF